MYALRQPLTTLIEAVLQDVDLTASTPTSIAERIAFAIHTHHELRVPDEDIERAAYEAFPYTLSMYSRVGFRHGVRWREAQIKPSLEKPTAR